jgi:hypothetical protein
MRLPPCCAIEGWLFVGLVLTVACAGIDRVVPEYSDSQLRLHRP